MLKEKMRVFKSGNSNALRLSKKLTEMLEVKPGDNLELTIDDDGQVKIIKEQDAQLEVSDNFKELLTESYQENSEAMEMLKRL